MDQAKWALPRLRSGITTKSMGQFQRPKLKLQACWLHNVSLDLYLVDPRQAGDSSLVAECAMQTLELAAAKFAGQGACLPQSLAFFADNTVKESKNNCQLALLGTLTSIFKFRSTMMLHARVGHTHGPLGVADKSCILKVL